MDKRGFFEIGVYHMKTPANLGTLWRAAYQLGAAGIFVIGKRYRHQASDTVKAYRHVPLREYASFDEFQNARPHGCSLIAVEMGGWPLDNSYRHAERAQYLLGAEDHGIPSEILAKCQSVISLGSIRTESFNVAVAGSIVMYHRQFFGRVHG